MISNQVLERFAKDSPITVMARLAGLERALDAKWVDELFERQSESQYTRELRWLGGFGRGLTQALVGRVQSGSGGR